MIRLQKYLAIAGIASRRGAEKIIAEGKVRVNGVIVTEMGVQIDEDADAVEVDNKPVEVESKKVYIVLNKPIGYITTASDDRGRKTVMELVDDIPYRIYPVGRLDYNTEGLIIMTNDGDMAYKLTHPKHNVEKTYQADVGGNITMEHINSLRSGVVIEGKRTSPSKVEVIGATQYGTKIEITIHEGRNRQVRKMFETLGLTVNKLKRTQEAGIALGRLQSGKYRVLSESEVNLLKKGGLNRDRSDADKGRRGGRSKPNNKNMGKK